MDPECRAAVSADHAASRGCPPVTGDGSPLTRPGGVHCHLLCPGLAHVGVRRLPAHSCLWGTGGALWSAFLWLKMLLLEAAEATRLLLMGGFQTLAKCFIFCWVLGGLFFHAWGTVLQLVIRTRVTGGRPPSHTLPTMFPESRAPSGTLQVPAGDSFSVVECAVPRGRLLWMGGVPCLPSPSIALTTGSPDTWRVEGWWWVGACCCLWSPGAPELSPHLLHGPGGGLCSVPSSPASVRWILGGGRSRVLHLSFLLPLPRSCIYPLRWEHCHGALPAAVCCPRSRPHGLGHLARSHMH